MTDIFLGLDLGTSSCKLIAFDREGRALAEATRDYPVLNPGPGWFELDAETVWERAEACFREVDAARLSGRVRTLGISVLGEAMVALDADGKALGPAPISADIRCMDEVETLRLAIGDERIYAITGQPLSPIYTLPKLMWWRRHRPEWMAKAAKFLCFGDFALLRLGLSPVIDDTMASRALLFDRDARRWSDELLALAGVRPDQLAAIGRSGDAVGVIPPDVAERLHLPAGVTVILGGHDQAMGALGAGVVEPGMAMYSIGTTEALVVAVRQPVPAFGPGNIPCSAHVVPGAYAALAGNQSGGRALAWYREAMGIEAEGGAQPIGLGAAMAALSDEPPTWPLLLPHFLGSGSVLNDPASLAALIGLRFDTSRADLLHAVLEGISFEQALSLEALQAAGPIDSVRAVGGGTRSPFWLQMKADILDRPVTRILVKDAPCLASAILGRASVEPDCDIAELVREMVRAGETFQPRAERHRQHAVRLSIYRDLYKALRPLADRLHQQWADAAA